MASPFDASPRTKDDDLDYKEDDEESDEEGDEKDVPEQVPRRKRRHSSQSDAFRSTSQSTKRWQHFSSRPDPSATIRASDVQVRPTAKPGVEIFVIASCGSRVIIKQWPGGTLKDKNLNTIFDEVLTVVSRNGIQRINFKLETLKKENGLECLIERDDTAVFEVMTQKFDERMKQRRKAGETRFKILLEADPEQQGAAGAEVNEDSESDGDIW